MTTNPTGELLAFVLAVMGTACGVAAIWMAAGLIAELRHSTFSRELNL